MKRRFAYTLGVVALVLLAASAALAIDAPHNYNCTICHVVHRTLGTKGTDNICLACHNSSYPATIHKFQQTDLANPFGSTVLGSFTSGKGKHSSHNWSASDRIPAAGATAPTNVYMNNPSSITGSVTCARCHEIHAGYADYTGTNPKRSQPLLRMRNDTDQMCLDCHQSRNKPDAMQGTHPVNFAYADPTRGPSTKPNDYYSQPIINTANPTANMKLVNGLVLCSTCHAPHFADSNASTFDNNSSAVQGKLSSSRGYLLRTNLKGKTATDSAICTNCHKSADNPATPTASMRNHNGSKNQNIQCADCHGGHVDYDPADPTGSLGKNIFLINRYMNVSTQYGAIRNKQVLYLYTSASLKNYNKNASGVCVACHSLPSTVAQHSSTDATVCSSCHQHSAGFSANCTTCHGYPPTQAVASGPNGYAVDPSKGYNYLTTSGAYKDESATPHGSHAAGGTSYYSYGCTECHNGNNHDNGNFQQVFVTANSSLVSNGKGTTGVTAPTYATASPGTCATYCHSNGAPRGQAYVTTSPTWAGQKGTIIGTAGECTACHGDAASLSTNSHAKHVNATTGKGYSCDTCHATTVSGNTTITSKINHVNGVKEVSFSGTLASGSTMDSSATCTTYCHSSGQSADGLSATPVYAPTPPVWGGTAPCGSCHATTTLATGNHTKHLAKDTNCGNCHANATSTSYTATTHVNGLIDVANGYTGGGAPGNGYGTCSTISCHSGGGLFSAPTAQWGTTLNCDGCHPRASLSGAHQYHIDASAAMPTVYLNMTGNKSAGATYSFGCSICHPLSNPGHANGTIVIDFRPTLAGAGTLRAKNSSSITAQATAVKGGSYGSSTGVTGTAGSSVICNNVYCHSNGGGSGGTVLTTTTYYASPDWYGTISSGQDKCSMCHGNMPNSTGSFGARTGSPAHYSNSWLGYANVSSGHSLGFHDKNIYKGGNQNGLVGKTSGTPSAHGNTTLSTTLNCNVCHNLTVTTTANDKNNVCVACHKSGNTVGALAHNPGGFGSTNDMQLIANTAYHVNGSLNITFRNMTGYVISAQVRDAGYPNYSSSWRRPSGYKTANSGEHWNPKQVPSYSAGTCSNIACHNGQAVRWNKPTADPVTNGNLTCQSCHTDL